MTAGETAPAQTEVATQEVVTILTSKILEMISEMKELMVHLVPVLLRWMSAPLPPYEGTTTTIVEVDQEALYQHRHLLRTT